MIFKTLQESASRDELILIDNGFCHWHLRKDGQLTIREIIVLPNQQGKGIGTRMLEILKHKKTRSIFAKCEKDSPSNSWFQKKGFQKIDESTSRTGKKLNHWELIIK